MRTLRGALIGFGFIGSKGHFPAYEKMRADDGRVEIVAIADPCVDRLAVAAKMAPRLRLYGDFCELFRAERDGLDFVDIVAPPRFHHQIAAAALRTGFHVLCEKPLAISAGEAGDLASLALECRRVLMPCHNYRHAPVMKVVRDALEADTVGPIKGVSLSTYRHTHARGTPEWAPHWRRDQQVSGGGIVMDHGSHSFYMCFEWLRGYPLSISARTLVGNPCYDTEDDFMASLTFDAGLANVALSWTAGMRKVVYALRGARGGIRIDDDDVEIASQRDTIEVDGATGWHVQRQQAPSDWMDASHTKWFGSVITDFAAAIETETVVGRELRDAVMCLHTIEAAYRSARENCRDVVIRPLPSWLQP